MSALDNLPRASFDGVEFPIENRSAKLVARHHVHEFPKMPGGAVEKMGRKVWEFTISAPFHATILGYTDLYPGALRTLTDKAEKLVTGPLLIPELGTIRAMLAELTRERVGKVRSGEHVTLRFVEDDLEPFKRAQVPTSKASVDTAKARFDKALEAAKLEQPEAFTALEERERPKRSIFDLIDDVSTLVASIRDQAELYGNLFAARLAKLTALLQEADATVDFLGDAKSVALAQALRDLWDAAAQLEADISQRGERLVPYVVPSRMAVADIATRLYGDASRGGEILSLNDIGNPFAVTAGTRLVVYAQ